MKKLNGKLTISRGSDDVVRIEVVDELSGRTAIEVSCSLEVFGSAVTGLSYQPVEFEFNDSGVVGMRREIKHETVFVRSKSYDDKALERAIKKAFAPLEADGWEGSVRDAMNHHNMGKHTDDGYYVSVVFRRYVPVEAEVVG